MRTARCSFQIRPRRPRKSVGLTQNPHPFGEVLPPAAQRSWAADDITKSSALLGSAPPLPSPAGPWGRPDGFFQSGFWRPKWCQWGPFRIRTARCSFQNRPRRPRKNVGLTQNPHPFGKVLPTAAQHSWAADDITKSSALLGSAPPLPSPAGPWGRPDGFFQSGFWRPKWCQWGPFRIRTARCSFQNRLRRPRKNVGMREILTPFGRAPLPPYNAGLGWGATAARARPMAPIYIISANGRFPAPPRFRPQTRENLGRGGPSSS